MRIGLSFDQGTPKYALYAKAVEAAAQRDGVDVEMCWLAGAGRRFAPEALAAIDALVLTGGADVEPMRYGRADAAPLCDTFAERDTAELAILEKALEQRLPILAICRGMQLLNVYLGGTLIPDLATAGHRLSDVERHPVSLEPASMLAEMAGGTAGNVTSSHHQALAGVARDLRISARHADGTVEAVEWREPAQKAWLVAIQWHPERMTLDEPLAGPIYQNFLRAAAAPQTRLSF